MQLSSAQLSSQLAVLPLAGFYTDELLLAGKQDKVPLASTPMPAVPCLLPACAATSAFVTNMSAHVLPAGQGV